MTATLLGTLWLRRLDLCSPRRLTPEKGLMNAGYVLSPCSSSDSHQRKLCEHLGTGIISLQASPVHACTSLGHAQRVP